MNITELVSWYTCAQGSPGDKCGQETAGSKVYEHSALRENAKLFSRAVALIYTPNYFPEQLL